MSGWIKIHRKFLDWEWFNKSEAVFGRGEFFAIVDDRMDQDKNDIALVRQQMHEDFKFYFVFF